MERIPLERRLSTDLVRIIKENLEYYSKKNNDTDISWENVGSVHCMSDGVTIVKRYRELGYKNEDGWYLVWEPYNLGRVRTHLEDGDLEWNFNYGDHWLKL